MPRTMTPDQPGRFDTLDGLRGIAALCIMLLHCGSWIGQLSEFGYLAVDFFFCLSGFILGYVYDGRAGRGPTTVAFLRGRIRRLYPLYLLGALLGLAVLLGSGGLDLSRRPADAHRLAVLTLAAGLMMPFPLSDPEQPAWPLNSPSWSLSFEMAASVAYALWLRRAGKASLLALAAAGWVFLCWATVSHGTMEVGFSLATLPGGLARIAFSFPLGVLIARLHGEGRLAAIPALHPGVPAALLAAVLFCPLLCDRRAIEIPAATLVLPLVLVLGIRSPAGPWAPACRELGRLSYPLYALHVPIFVGVMTFAPALPERGPGALAVAAGACALAVAAAALAVRTRLGGPGLAGRA